MPLCLRFFFDGPSLWSEPAAASASLSPPSRRRLGAKPSVIALVELTWRVGATSLPLPVVAHGRSDYGRGGDTSAVSCRCRHGLQVDRMRSHNSPSRSSRELRL